MLTFRNSYLLRPEFSNHHEKPLAYVDVGARGSLDRPWSLMPSRSLLVVGFEPDEAECKRLNQEAAIGRCYIPAAIWSKAGQVPFHLAKIRTCSSVYPPNTNLLSPFDQQHTDCRQTDKIISFPAITLDAALAEQKISCDFLKIDTQGAEYDILEGGELSLQRDVLAVLVETWSFEVHQGQKFTSDVMSLMRANGFNLFDVGIAAAWKRKTASKYKVEGKRQVIGFDLLFLKNVDQLVTQSLPISKFTKLSAIAEIFGFPDYALEVLDSCRGPAETTSMVDEARKIIIQNSNRRSSLSQRIIRKLGRLTGAKVEDYPSLHY